jgi:uncharacterized membrane protein YkoI
MTRNKKWIIGGACAAIGVVGIGAGVAVATDRAQPQDPESERNAEAAYTQAHSGEAKVSEQQAVDTALARHPGRVVDVHLENEGRRLRWEVKPDDGQQVWEVQVDSMTGDIVSDQPDE